METVPDVSQNTGDDIILDPPTKQPEPEAQPQQPPVDASTPEVATEQPNTEEPVSPQETQQPVPQQPQYNIAPELLDVFTRTSNQAQQATSPDHTPVSNGSQVRTAEEENELYDSDPVKYHSQREQRLNDQIGMINQKIDNIPGMIAESRQKNKTAQLVNTHITGRNPEYDDPNSQFSRDVAGALSRMKENPELMEMAAASLVELATKQPGAINQAKQQGAREENLRATTAKSSIGGASVPQPNTTKVNTTDPYYQKFGKAFGIEDTVSMQARIEKRISQEKQNSFVD